MSFMSRKGAQELQMLIFVLAFFHVLTCLLTFSLGMAKVSVLMALGRVLSISPSFYSLVRQDKSNGFCGVSAHFVNVEEL